MKYTLHIAFDNTLGDAVLRTCEYVKKYGESLSPYFEPLLMEMSGDGAIVSRPEKSCPTADAVILALELYSGVPLRWALENKRIQLSNSIEIEDFFEQKYSKNIIEDEPVDPELHIMLYAPLYEVGISENVKQVIENLTVGQKYIVNILAIPYDIAHSCGLKHPVLNREERYIRMRANAEELVKLRNANPRLRHIFTFQNFNINGQSKDFDYAKFIKTCGELSMALIGHYDTVCHYSILDRPFYAINADSRVIDKYLIIDKWFRDLFQENVRPYIIDESGLDKEKVRGTFRKILKQETELVKNYKNQHTESLESQSDYDKLFDRDVKDKIREIIKRNIEEDGLNITEQKFLLSLFKQITDDTDLEGEDIDESLWQLEDFKLDELEIPNDSDSREAFRQLRQYSKDIAELKDVINEQERIIDDLKGKISQDYDFDGELTDEGFKIGDSIFKPYRYQEIPLDEDYNVPENIILPDSVDLRKDFSPIRNQRHQGACSAFSLVSVIEFFLRRAMMEQFDLSEAFVYYNARNIKNQTNVDSGCTFQEIIKAIRDNGVCLEELCPFNPDVFDESPTEEAYVDGESRKVTEAKNVRLCVDDIKSALSQGFPVVISIRVFDSFVKNVSGFVNIPLESELKEDENHAMVICGYSDKEGYFIVRNSWGTRFGDNGYCYLPYDYIRNPKLVNAAYAVTGLNIDGYEEKEIPIADSLLNNRDYNTQHVININILREKQRLLEEDREKLKNTQKRYVELYNQLINNANLELSLNEIKIETDSQRRILEQDLVKEIERQRGANRLFSLFRRGNRNNITQIKRKLEELNSMMDGCRKNFRKRSAIFSGLTTINQELLEESIRIQQLSDEYSMHLKRIAEQNETDDAVYRKVLEDNQIPLDNIYEEIRNRMDVKSIFSEMYNTLRDAVKGEIGFYEIFGEARAKLINILTCNFNFNITDYINEETYQHFFYKMRHSAIMVQVDGGLPDGYGDETKYFFSNLAEKPKQLKKDNINSLTISDKLRMSFLHIEKYNIDDLYVFREESWKKDQ